MIVSDHVKDIIKQYERRLGAMSLWYEHYDDLAQVHLPFSLGFTTSIQPGDQLTAENFDGTPMHGARSLSNNVGFFLRPENQDWIRMKIDNDQINDTDEARQWIGASLERFITALRQPSARFQQATSEVDTSLVVFGTGLLFVGENRLRNGFLFRSLTLKTTIPIYNEEDGTLEGAFDCRMWEIRELEKKFGRNRLSKASREKLDRGAGDEKIKVLHSILPRKNGNADAVMSKNLPIEQMWIEYDEKHVLLEAGFHEMPVVGPRWDTTSGEQMGRSPAMIALPDSNTLQAQGETILVSGQRAADPPIMVPNDGSFSEINTFPGGISYYDVETASQIGGNPFFHLDSKYNLPITRDMQEDTRGQVLAAFLRNILNLPIDGPQMTATEVLQRKDEFIREVGPVFGRLETDYIAPMIERAFSIMLRAGGFPPVPDILGGENIKFEFESPITKIRQQIKAAAAQLWVQEQMELAALDPSAKDLVNLDAYARFRADAAGIPPEIVNDKKTVQEMRQARSEELQRQQKVAEEAQTAENADRFAGVINKAAQAQERLTPKEQTEEVGA